jgi:site-specific DNA-methyltransferase (adenine-specific)
MKPYFETKLGKLYHGDCLEIMPHIEPVELILADPPYGVDLKYDSYIDSEYDHVFKIKTWFPVLRKKARILGISCGIGNIWNWPKADWVICWHKVFSVSKSLFGANNWEPLLVYTEKGRLCERRSDYFKATFMKIETNHPCPKPIGWALESARILTKKNETILDPFLGSGTTAIACERLSRRWIGIEISEKYCEIAAKRIEQEAQQLKLF